MSDPYLWILSAVIFIPMCVVGLARIQVWEEGFEDQVLLTPGFFLFYFIWGRGDAVQGFTLHTAMPIIQSLQVNPLHRINCVQDPEV